MLKRCLSQQFAPMVVQSDNLCPAALGNLTLILVRQIVRVLESPENGLATYLMIGREGALSLRCSPVVSLKVELRLWVVIVSGKIGSWFILKFDLCVNCNSLR